MQTYADVWDEILERNFQQVWAFWVFLSGVSWVSTRHMESIAVTFIKPTFH